MSIDSKIQEILEESKLAGMIVEDEVELSEDDLPEKLTEEEFNALPEEIQEMYQLDELSKKTLGSYIKKAAGGEKGAASQAMMAAHNPNGGHFSKAVKRVKGIEKATDKLTKEEVSVDVSADVEALINGETLSEEFKTKAATIFEAAVVTRVKEEVARLEEEFESKLGEQVDTIVEGLVEKIDGYLDYVVEQWMEQNEIALEYGVKGEIMESFISGMRNLFEEHYIDVPEEKYDVIGEMESKIDELSAKLDEQVESNIELKRSLQEASRKDIVKTISEGLSDTQVEKFMALAEELSYESAEAFTTKVKTIRENYFTGKPSTIIESVVSDSPVQEVLSESNQIVDPVVALYAQAIKQLD